MSAVLEEERRRARAKRLEAAAHRVRETVETFLTSAAKGEVHEMLQAGVRISVETEEIVKIVTGTEVLP